MLLLSFLLISTLHTLAAAQPNTWNYACDSLICDPPKTCVVQDQVAQCLLLNEANGSPSPQVPEIDNQQTTTIALPTFPNIFGGLNVPNGGLNVPNAGLNVPNAGTSTPSPFAPFLNLFSPGPPLTLPTLPTPSTTTSKPKVDICELPPLTGNCSKARIMWYYDTETGKCERFSYSGCGNENRFPSKIQCEQRCPGFGRR